MTNEEFAKRKAQYEIEKQKALKDRKRSKFVAAKGSFTFSSPPDKAEKSK